MFSYFAPIYLENPQIAGDAIQLETVHRGKHCGNVFIIQKTHKIQYLYSSGFKIGKWFSDYKSIRIENGQFIAQLSERTLSFRIERNAADQFEAMYLCPIPYPN